MSEYVGFVFMFCVVCGLIRKFWQVKMPHNSLYERYECESCKTQQEYKTK